MVKQDFTLANSSEEGVRRFRIDIAEFCRGLATKWLVLQLREIKICYLIEASKIKRRVVLNDIDRFNLKLIHEFVEYLVMNDLIYLKSYRRPKASARKFLLHAFKNVISLIFIEIEILITGDAEEEVIFKGDAREEF